MDAHTIRAAGPEDAREMLTLQRAAYVTEAQLYDDPNLPALTQTLPPWSRSGPDRWPSRP
ncbi:MAG TPA: hypothetical protein VMM13_20410 [Euzebya sp.]|nr:hypothetical protein [Euzebya sp.]